MPTPTLYCNNLNDKIHRTLMKETLYLLFSNYGSIISISTKLRGQAFITFTELQSAAHALQLNQHNIFDKMMHVQFAKEQSHSLQVYHGNYKEVEMDMEMEEIEEVNESLVVTILPSEVTDDMLSLLFQQYEGFKGVRLVPGRQDMAYVDYHTAEQARIAKM